MNENDDKNAVKLSFYRINDLIFRFDQDIKNHYYQSHQLCIFHSIITNILNIAHNDTHLKYARYYEKILFNYYIRGLTRYLKNYLNLA